MDARAMAENFDIFGDADDMLGQFQAQLAEEEGGEEGAEARAREAAAPALDPALLAKYHLGAGDKVLRETDLPEREQLGEAAGLGALPAVARAEQAQWVLGRLLERQLNFEPLETSLVERGAMLVEGEVAEAAALAEGSGMLGGAYGRRRVRAPRSDEDIRLWRANPNDQEELLTSIREALRLIQTEHLEVPFIAAYRQEQVGPLLALRQEDCPHITAEDAPGLPKGTVLPQHRKIRRYDVLWAVKALGARWARLERLKAARREAYERALDAAEGQEDRKIFSPVATALQDCIESLDSVELETSLADVDSKFKLFGSLLPEEAFTGGLKRPARKGPFVQYMKNGHGALADLLGLPPGQFGENLNAPYKMHEPEDPSVTPEGMAASLLPPDSNLPPETAVLCACHVAAERLAAEPTVRSFVRDRFFESAYVRTSASDPGAIREEEIPFSQYGLVSRLRKPVKAFAGDTWLLIKEGEKEGLIQTKVSMEPEQQPWMDPGMDSLLDLMKKLAEGYEGEGVSDSAKAWNAARRKTLETMLYKLLLPSLQAEARQELSRHSGEFLKQKIADAAWKHVARPPWTPTTPLAAARDGSQASGEDVRVMAGIWGPGEPATCFVVLDLKGQLVDLLWCGQLSGPLFFSEPGSLFTDLRRSNDTKRLREFMLLYQPQVCALGGASVQNMRLKAMLQEIWYDIIDRSAKELHAEGRDFACVHWDCSVAKLWESSDAAQREFADQPTAIRHAIALGRYVIDPLAVFASVCGQGREILSLPLDPLQAALSDDERLGAVGLALETATCQVGVEVNLAAHHEWRAAPLQYVAGLGPRKAASLVRSVRGLEGGVLSRRDALAGLPGVGQKVYENAAGFLRVKVNLDDDLDEGGGQELDRSRVHPESYPLALDLAAGGGEEDGPSPEDDAGQRLLARAFRDAAAVEAVDVRDVESGPVLTRSGERKLATLLDIRAEFLAPYGDVRGPWAEPVGLEEVTLLTGETAETLKEGRLVHVTIKAIKKVSEWDPPPTVVFVEFDSGMVGFIPRHEFSATLNETGEQISRDCIGQVVQARITSSDFSPRAKVLFGRESWWTLTLSSLSDALRDCKRWETKYCERAEEHYLPYSAEHRRRRKAKQLFVPRPIEHPLFRNVSKAEAEQLLEAMDDGECVMRPSSNRTSIALALKVHYAGPSLRLILHVEIKENPHKQGGVKSNLQLKAPLRVAFPGQEKEEYDDLDEIVARFVEPLMKRVAELKTLANSQRDPYFVEGSWHEVEDTLLAKKGANPKRVFIQVCPNYDDRKSLFRLAYIFKNTPQYEPLQARPDGFGFRGETFRTLRDVMGYFRKHPNRPAPKPRKQPEPALAHNANMGPAAPAAGFPPQGAPLMADPQGWGGAPPMQPYGHSQPPAPVPVAGYGAGEPGWGAPPSYGQPAPSYGQPSYGQDPSSVGGGQPPLAPEGGGYAPYPPQDDPYAQQQQQQQQPYHSMPPGPPQYQQQHPPPPLPQQRNDGYGYGGR